MIPFYMNYDFWSIYASGILKRIIYTLDEYENDLLGKMPENLELLRD